MQSPVAWAAIPALVPLVVRPCPSHLPWERAWYPVGVQEFISFFLSPLLTSDIYGGPLSLQPLIRTPRRLQALKGPLQPRRTGELKAGTRTDTGFDSLLTPGSVFWASYTYPSLW